MCITVQCSDPTEVGIWWRDDASWKLYSEDSTRAILQAFLQGKPSLQLHLSESSGLLPQAGASYLIDLSKMEQTNERSGHKRAIKLILPSFDRKEPSPALQGFMEVRIRMRGSNCLLVIRLGNIAEWKGDGELDAVVSPCCSRKSSQLAGKGGSLQKSAENVGATHILSSFMKGAMSDSEGKSFGSLQNSGKMEPTSDQPEEAQYGHSVSAAIHRAAGPKLQVALQRTVYFASGEGQCGDAVITPGFELPASHVVHTFAPPKYRMHEEAASIAKLEKTYKSALSLAALNGIQYIAFPAISCGAGKFPLPIAARVALEATSCNSNDMLEIHFVIFDQNALSEWIGQASKIFAKA